MKVLFDHSQPFSLAHGGLQVQLEQTAQALVRSGLTVDYLRWWDSTQAGDLIHFFGLARPEYLRSAALRRVCVVMTPLFSATCNRARWRLELQAAVTRSIMAMPFLRKARENLTWNAYRQCAHLTVGLEAEKEVLERIHDISPAQISVIPLGVSNAFLQANPGHRRGNFLITTGTITRVKGSVALARLALRAEVPILFVGKPYDPSDSYWQEFQSLVDNRRVMYHPHVQSDAEMIRLLQGARGFVLRSDYENWSLATSEAIACGLPILVQDQRWSRERFGGRARYFTKSEETDARVLCEFYRETPNLPVPEVKLFSWDEIAHRLKATYATVLKASR
jgi:glycosyltransferase involved in cell wall biosynthesis